jgi:hypothetical protein
MGIVIVFMEGRRSTPLSYSAAALDPAQPLHESEVLRLEMAPASSSVWNCLLGYA